MSKEAEPKDGTLNNRFEGFYAIHEKALKELWAKALFVLDANVLLNLYRYPLKAREDLLQVLTSVRDRLWVPHHAALEYQRNRLGVIAEQKTRFHDVTKLVQGIWPYVSGQLENMQLGKRHSAIDPTEFLNELRSVVEKFSISLDALERKQPDVYQQDPIRDELETLLTVGPAPKNQQALEELIKDAPNRYQQYMPPGFRDLKKSESKQPTFSYGGLSYERKDGDLIMWKQIVAHAKEANLGHLIFVTDDDKDDWWYYVESQGSKRIGPRPELIDEIKRATRVAHFHMYTSERFLDFARQYLAIKIHEESIAQVAEVRQSVSQAVEAGVTGREAVRDAVTRWLAANASSVEAVEKEAFLNLIVEDKARNRFGVFIRPYDVLHGNVGVLIQSMRMAEIASRKRQCVGTDIVIGTAEEANVDVLTTKLQAALANRGEHTQLTVGVVSAGEDGRAPEFEPLMTFPRARQPI